MPSKQKETKQVDVESRLFAKASASDDEWEPEDLNMFRFLRRVLNHIDLAYVATYPPQECGIATFTRDLSTAISKYTPFSNPFVIAVGEGADIEQFPKIVKFQITKSDPQSYVRAAEMVNNSAVRGVSLQHEYGIFGGLDGEYVLKFVEKLERPTVVTLHTVLFNPGPNQKRIVQELGRMCDALVVMVKMGKEMLVNNYGIPANKVAIIPHGVPNVHRVSAATIKKTLGISDRPVISSFGLINRGKGIEYGIQAMPGILKKHPDAMYLVLGETHPGVRHNEGESYRKELLQIVADLGLEKNVRFNNRYLKLEELINYLCATDVYITPYINRDQIVSGTLAYALGCGKAIVSTPYLYAEEVLSGGRGLLVDFRNPDQLSGAANRILDDAVLREQMETKAYKYGRRAAWFNVAIDYLDLFHRLCPRPKAALGKDLKVSQAETRKGQSS